VYVISLWSICMYFVSCTSYVQKVCNPSYSCYPKWFPSNRTQKIATWNFVLSAVISY